jgi:chromate transporter
MAYFYNELVRKRGWVTDADFLEGASISSLIPGPNVTNLSVYFGQRLAGPAGALLGTLAVTVPGAVLLLLISSLYFHGLGTDISTPIGRGVGAAAVALIATTAWRTGAAAVRAPRGALIAALTFALYALVGLNIFIVLAIMGPVSIWLHRPGTRRTDSGG